MNNVRLMKPKRNGLKSAVCFTSAGLKSATDSQERERRCSGVVVGRYGTMQTSSFCSQESYMIWSVWRGKHMRLSSGAMRLSSDHILYVTTSTQHALLMSNEMIQPDAKGYPVWY